MNVGAYSGVVTERYRSSDILQRLGELETWLESPAATTLGSGGRNRHVRIAGLLGDDGPEVMVKAFGAVSLLNRARDRQRGSKARRTWLAADHLRRNDVGTPMPIAYLERSGRARESYYLAVYEAHAVTFLDALATLFADYPQTENFLALVACVAAGVRAMHDAGFVHNDLGNQNILVTPDGPGRWRNFQVVDLNRGRLRPGPLGTRERSRDLSRIALPSHLMQIFTRMYWQAPPSQEAARWQRLYRKVHYWRVRSRRWRHPFREARLKRAARDKSSTRGYPKAREMWIWDERTGQPLQTMLRDERTREYPLARHLRLAVDTARAGGRIWRAYRPFLASAFTEPVALGGRIGMAIEPLPTSDDHQLALLRGLGRIPVLVRFYHHEPAASRKRRTELVASLHRAGHALSIALVQNREAVRDARAWDKFAHEVLDAVAPIVDLVELGHCINRTKWGIWDHQDVHALYAPLARLHAHYPGVAFVGPAAIDFELPFVISALREWPAEVPLSALSHLLYVDRRGAPEVPQGGFALVEKLALLRAIARVDGRTERLVISEVNWPIAGTAPYSPIGPPFVFPGQGAGNGGTSEDDYANYMIRYLALATASGLANRVYWWRLVARGFGLVDDTDPGALRPRPAYSMLRTYQSLLGDSTFVTARLPAPIGNRHGRHRLAFRRPDGEIVVLTYAHGPALPFPDDETFARVEDAFGAPMSAPPAQLTGRPIYLRSANT